jgi:hypothetical protein
MYLSFFVVDLNQVSVLKSKKTQAFIPAAYLKIGDSGIRTHEQTLVQKPVSIGIPFKYEVFRYFNLVD